MLRTLLKNILFVPLLRLYYRAPSNKAAYELYFWHKRWLARGGKPGGAGEGHAAIIQAFMGETPKDHTILDFGCGPVCGLESFARENTLLGVDVLAKHYDSILRRRYQHHYTFVQCTEKEIPVESGSVDIVYSANALDHCIHPYHMLTELHRTLKPAGTCIGVFNIEKTPSLTEPSILDPEELLAAFHKLYSQVKVVFSDRGPAGSFYSEFLAGKHFAQPPEDREAYLMLVHARDKK